MLGSKRAHWRKLDNAAKIFPATSSKRDTRVFRFYCELKQEVEGDTLQKALDRAIEKYPVFLSVMRKGVFWYYLEKSPLRPQVREETDPPCLHLYLKDRKTLLFQVTYYKTRINFEVFHALTDGTGAIQFLKELVKNYLLLQYPGENLPDISFTEEDMTLQDQEDDSFTKYYERGKKGSEKKASSYQITGPRTGYGSLNITEGLTSCRALLQKAKEYGVSLTVFLTAVFMCAIHEERGRRKNRRPIVLMVPVNLRKYFASSSMLNFFGWIEPGYLFKGGKAGGGREMKAGQNASAASGGNDQGNQYDFREVVEAVSAYFKKELTAERLGQRMNSLMGLELNPILRLIPLQLKNIGMQLGAQLAKKDVTAIFSNLGNIILPDEYAAHVLRFGVFTSTPKIELSMCSYRDDLVMSFASGFQNQNIERNFFRILKGFGIEVEPLTDRFPQKTVPGYQGLKLFQWFSFASICAVVVAVMINLIFTPGLYWSAFAAGGALSMWIALAVGFFKRHNLLKNGVWQMLLLPAVCAAWDAYTGWHGWSVDYVLPGVCLVIQISMMIITRVQRLTVQEYMIYHIIAGLFGLLPALLLALGVSHFVLLSVLCGGISFMHLASLIIFKGKDMFVELYKKLHF